ncbi:MAG: HAMP domain-containing histidine kinase [Deltaproteobacteria bacterium]|nr:HAMP domain-containing histidine kinase [Deltaproteobacteria bacterium]
MPTPLVIVERGSAALVYANRAASRFASAFAPDAILYDERGGRVGREALPHVVAAAGHSFDRRVLELRDQHAWLMFHAHVLEAFAVLTFDDVTALHDVHAELRDAISTRDEVVSMASHELRSPIGALALVVEQVLRKAKNQALDDIARLAEIGTRQVKRLTVLVGNLLDVSRLRAGRFEIDREKCDLAAIVRDAAGSLEDQARHGGGAGMVIEADTPIVGEWDAMRMDQVVVNLVTNSIKYGQGTPICVRLTRDGDSAVLVVEDCGPGIEPEHQQRIFEPFQRATDTAKAHSLGLGLYIVNEIVKAHGGTIDVESRPGFTRFTVTLPIQMS